MKVRRAWQNDLYTLYAFLLVQEILLEILLHEIKVYSSSLVLKLAMNSVQFKLSVIRRRTTKTDDEGGFT